jgi:glycosyltransferase involved in cell wall biosynthesis
VIASNSTSIPEVAGTHATLIDPLSVTEIARAMRNALPKTSQASERSARQEHARRFTWRQSAFNTESLLLSYC